MFSGQGSLEVSLKSGQRIRGVCKDGFEVQDCFDERIAGWNVDGGRGVFEQQGADTLLADI